MAETDTAANIVGSSKEVFTKKVGPAPLWVWAALGMGVLFVVSRNKRKMSSSSAATANPENVPVPDTWMPSTAFMPQGYVPSTDETTADEYTIYTNEDWVVAAARKMASSHSDNTTVLRRLRQYVGGGAYPQDEYDATLAIAEEAIMAVGPPPKAISVLQVAGTAPVPPPPSGQIPSQPPPPQNVVNNGQVAHFQLSDFGGSLEAAAAHYYNDPNAWYKFRVGNDPASGWLNPQSYMELATGKIPADTVFAVGPDGRLRD